jgi:hypothetical protein
MMNRNYLLRISLCAIMATSSAIQALTLTGLTFYSPRSQSTDAARLIVGWHPYINKPNQSLYGALTAAPSYGGMTRSRRSAEVLFSTNNLTVSGSQVENRGENDFLADFFGLSPSFYSNVTLHPSIQTFLVDFGWYIGWQNWYFVARAPAVRTRWNIDVEELVVNNGTTTPFPANYMDFPAVPEPITSFKQAVRGGVTWGQVSQGMQYGTFGCPQTTHALSDLQMAIGYNIVNNETGFAGFNLRASAPTGTRPDGTYLFEPIVGNGHHWELGVGFSGKAVLWEKDGTQDFSFFCDINYTYLFKAHQRRSFDFTVNGMCSRYILVKEFDGLGNYTGVCQPAINATTLNCDVWTDLELDIVFMLAYTSPNWIVDLGYEGWIRSHEKIALRQCIPENRYGFKGIQNVTDIFGNVIETTQNSVTINGNNFADQASVANISPVFIKTSDLSLKSAASPLVMTHKLFGNLSYAFPCDYRRVVPFIGFGGDIEFEGINRHFTVRNDKDTLSQWSVWIKGGFGY